MTKKLFAVVLMSLTLAACESAGTDNSNASNAKPNTNTAASTPAPVAPSPEPTASIKPQLKPGDKVKVMISGSATDATVVSVDDKAGKVTVKVQAQKEAKTVAIADVVKQ
jgi:sRNA-binding protein